MLEDVPAVVPDKDHVMEDPAPRTPKMSWDQISTSDILATACLPKASAERWLDLSSQDIRGAMGPGSSKAVDNPIPPSNTKSDIQKRFETATRETNAVLMEGAAKAILSLPSDSIPEFTVQEGASDMVEGASDSEPLPTQRKLVEAHLDELLWMKKNLIAHHQNVVHGKYLAQKIEEAVARARWMRARDVDLADMRDEIQEAQLARDAAARAKKDARGSDSKGKGREI